MGENSVLYSVKSLDKMILRYILNDMKCNLFHPSPTQVQIMEYILKHKHEEIFQKDLENVLNLRRATVSGVLKTMEKNGLLNRELNCNDARSKKIIVSDKVLNNIEKNKNKMKDLEKLITKDITKEQLDDFLLIVSKMKSNLKDIEESRND